MASSESCQRDCILLPAHDGMQAPFAHPELHPSSSILVIVSLRLLEDMASALEIESSRLAVVEVRAKGR